ncbi:hypothetical protein V2S66_34070 [Streptomyces sp. V4-01]|uniref:Uncharacterized protein n=1 Tax=Actinacidiphila polyblastidii TaxID=3110430 RepID=A0ABU7PP18_9ACTN|nr:hypothetical protein [Streptomyces sp. V4-01]
MSVQEITVAVHGGDPLARAGLAAHFAFEPDLALIPERSSSSSAQGGDVAVVIIDWIDPAAAAGLGSVSRIG